MNSGIGLEELQEQQRTNGKTELKKRQKVRGSGVREGRGRAVEKGTREQRNDISALVVRHVFPCFGGWAEANAVVLPAPRDSLMP